MRRFVVLALACASCLRAEGPSDFRLRIAAVGPLGPLSPDLESGYEMIINGLVFEPLNHVAQNGADFRFRPRLDVTFSDGSPARPEDFVAALDGRATVDLVDGWLSLRPEPGGESPEAQLQAAALFRATDAGMVGTGPFVVAAQDAQHILLRRRQPIARRISEVELVSFASPREAFAGAMRGEVNMLLMPDEGELELFSGVDRLRVIRGPGVHSVAALFNPARLGVGDRLALSAALSAGSGVPCRRQTTIGIAGPVPAGVPLALLVANAQPELIPAALSLRRALGSRGGPVTVVTLEEARARAAARDFDLLVTSYQTLPTGFSTSSWLTTSPRNFTGYSNPQVDAALQASDYPRARAALAADPPAIELCRPDRTAAVDARLIDARLGTYDMLESVAAWQVAP